MSDPWDEEFESNGITLGPEAMLEREIARSKALKVERLRLRDNLSRMESRWRDAADENAALRQEVVRLRSLANRADAALDETSFKIPPRPRIGFFSWGGIISFVAGGAAGAAWARWGFF
ncbi:MAG: hypothetical protein ACE5ER_03075 [Nitrospinaceae bacterium]